MGKGRKHICGVEKAGRLDGFLRRLMHDPKKILMDYVHPGMKVLDAGCGPGYFSIAMAEMVGDSGKVIAADIQDGMLERLREKIRGKGIEKRLTLVKAAEGDINVKEKVDFVLAFYMVHEVPDRKAFLKQAWSVLSVGGKLMIAEPNFHVNAKEFKETVEDAESMGFVVVARPKIFLSRAVVLEV